jgi:DNA-binding transcriptional ArsR family regulator
MVLEALGDRTRRQIVDALRRGPSSVGDLAARLPVSRPAISQHLTVLRRSHLVTYEEFGTRNVYRLDTTGLEVLRAWTDSFWQTVLDSYADRVRADSAAVAAEPPARGPEPPARGPAPQDRQGLPQDRQGLPQNLPVPPQGRQEPPQNLPEPPQGRQEPPQNLPEPPQQQKGLSDA